jgi:hypothetical protein
MADTPQKKRGGWKQSEKQKSKARETIKRLRKEFPDKFNPKKNKSAADKSVVRPPNNTTTKTQPPPPVSAPASSPKPEPARETSPATPSNLPSPSPAEVSAPPIQPDSILFGHEEVQPPKIGGGQAAPLPQPPPGSPGTGSPELTATPPPQETRKYAVLIWGMIVKVCTGIFGPGMNPMVLKSETGEVLYDENAEGVKVWWNWLVSIGVKAFSPVVELWMFMLAYFGMRLPLIVQRFRKKKPAASPPATAAAGESPAPAPAKTETEEAPKPESKLKGQPPPATTEEATRAAEELN